MPWPRSEGALLSLSPDRSPVIFARSTESLLPSSTTSLPRTLPPLTLSFTTPRRFYPGALSTLLGNSSAAKAAGERVGERAGCQLQFTDVQDAAGGVEDQEAEWDGYGQVH